MKLRTLLLLGVAAAVITTPLLAQSPGVNSPYNPVWSIPIDSIKRTYGQSFTQLSLANGTITDIWTICGSGSPVLRVTNIRVNIRATAVQPVDVVLVKRSTQDLGGTVALGQGFSGVSQVGIPFDSTFAAAQGAATPYTANPTTLGTAVGNVASWLVYAGNLTTGTTTVPFEWLVDRPASAVVLRGVNQCLAVNLSNAVIPGGVANVSAEWTEE